MEHAYEIYRAPFERALRTPFTQAGSTLTSRKGFLFRFVRNGLEGYGEASPLPGFSTDSWEEIANTIVSKKALLQSTLPSVQMAVESAGLDLSNEEQSGSIHTNAVLAIQDIHSSQKSIHSLYEQGYRTFKLKVADSSWHTTAELIRSTFSLPNISFRLDSNSSLSLNSALQFIDKMPPKHFIEYWEDTLQTTASTNDWLQLTNSTNIPLALDQALLNPTALSKALKEEIFAYFIIKPSCIGGIEASMQAITKIQAAKKKYTITSAFESEIGTRAIIRFLFQLGRINACEGISTLNHFEGSYFPVSPLITQVPPRGTRERLWLANLVWSKLA